MTVTPLRRVFPAPRRKPSAGTVAVRWRLEILLVAGLAGWSVLLGFLGTVLVAAALALMLAVNPSARRAAIRVLQALVVPHRVRSGLLQAGVTDRSGRLPWLVRSYSRGETVFVRVWLRSGTTTADLRHARALLQAACGAADVEVVGHPTRHDRATIFVLRPRWGRWRG